MTIPLDEIPAYPAATAEWIIYLQGRFPDVQVSNKITGDTKFIRIRRIGGATGRNKFVDLPTMTVEVYAEDDAQAEIFAGEVRQAILRTRGRRLTPRTICKGISEYSGPYEDPDENHRSSRFSWTFEAALRATETEQE